MSAKHDVHTPGRRPRWLAAGVVEAPPGAVFAPLRAVGPAAAARLDTDQVTVEVDPNRRALAIQGRWWYRGVYTVRDCPRGSLLEYRVHNVATRGRWAVP